MSNYKTIARPYAKAIFNYALNADQLEEWDIILQDLSLIINNKQVMQFIQNPASSIEQHFELVHSSMAMLANVSDKKGLENTLHLLADNKRLFIIPDIYALFMSMRAEYEKTLVVDVISFAELNEKQHDKLIQSLSKRLQRKISLNISLDKSLLGGAIINAGGLVIDGSVRGKLNKLKTTLAA